MPVSGTCDLAADAARYPAMIPAASGADETVFDLVEVVQVLLEIEPHGVLEMLPPALHPTVPPSAFVTVYKISSGPWGPFVLADLRLNARVHDKPRSLLLGAIASTAEAAGHLSATFGGRTQVGDVTLRRYYDRIEVTASAGGIGALDLHLLQPTPVPTSPLPYAPLLNIARTSAGVQLIPIDPVLAASEAERGVPRLRCLEPAVFGEPRVAPGQLVAGWYAAGTLSMPAPGAAFDPS